MTGGRTGRYPFEHITRSDLGPTERHRAAVFLRDDYRCLAAGTAWASSTPCAGGVTLHRAPTTIDRAVELGPLWLRTFCTAHAALAGCDAAFDRDCVTAGWSVPLTTDVLPDLEFLPVRYPDGRWYRVDQWGERSPLTAPDAVRAIRDRRHYTSRGGRR